MGQKPIERTQNANIFVQPPTVLKPKRTMKRAHTTASLPFSDLLQLDQGVIDRGKRSRSNSRAPSVGPEASTSAQEILLIPPKRAFSRASSAADLFKSREVDIQKRPLVPPKSSKSNDDKVSTLAPPQLSFPLGMYPFFIFLSGLYS